jgi:hypothetical protein
MRPSFFPALFTLASCATPERLPSSQSSRAAENALHLDIEGRSIGGRPAMVVTLTNRSRTPICVRGDAVENPYSYEMELRLRDAHGRKVGLHPSGFIPPPLQTLIQLAPGKSAQGHYWLDTRFKGIGEGDWVPSAWRARAAVRFGTCADVEGYCNGRIGLCPDARSRRAVSDWQRLEPQARHRAITPLAETGFVAKADLRTGWK